MRIVVFPEHGGSAKEWRFARHHRVWLSLGGVAAAFVIASFIYILIISFQDVAAVSKLRHDLSATLQTKVHNRLLKRRLAADQLAKEQTLTQVQAISTDLQHVTGVLNLQLASTGTALPNLLSRLKSIKKDLPVVLTAAEQRATYLAHKPDELPVSGPITSWFGWRPNPFTGTGREFHPGLDIAVPMDTPVLSVGAGVVDYAGWKAGGYGYYVQVNNGYGIQSYFAHNSSVIVHVGETVHRGQVLALSGETGRSTGPHVYFGIEYRGIPVNPWPFIHSNPVSVN